MNREEALQLVDQLIANPNLRKHCLAVEAFMRVLARRFGEDEEEWGLVGLLHDADYEVTQKDPARHMQVICDIARERGAGERVIQGILAHGGQAPLDNSLNCSVYACDNLTGLITACALVHRDRQLASLTVDFVMKRFREKAFARSASREEILTCETNLGIPLPEFVGIGLEAMQSIHQELGL